MKNKSVLRKVCITNRFDRLCNFALIKIFPLITDQNIHVANSYAALKYAEKELKDEKKALKRLKTLARKYKDDKNIISEIVTAISQMETSQQKRHEKMNEIIEGEKVR